MTHFSRTELLDIGGYAYMGGISEGFYAVQKKGDAYHIGSDNFPAYENRFDVVGDFRDGLSFVQEKNSGDCFYIDTSGVRVH